MKKVVIIGASSGIGKELSKIFIQNNYVVGVTARRTELLSEMTKNSTGKMFVKHMDVAKPDEAIRAFEGLIREMGGMDVCGISAGVGFINPELAWEKEKETIDVNVSGFTAIADHAAKYFLAQRSGHLVGISSLAAIRGDFTAPAYSASKAFVSNYLEGLRIKMIKMKMPITVTDIRPGFVDTKMAQGEGLFWVAPVDKAAKQIYSAIERKKSKVYITRRWRFIAWILKIMPETRLAKL